MAPRPTIPPELMQQPFTLQEARNAGLTAEALKSKCWQRLARGLYCKRGLRVDEWHLLAAWRRMPPPNAVFDGLTAAWLHRLDVEPLHPIEVAVPPGTWVRSRRGLVARHRAVAATTARGLPTATVDFIFSGLKRRLPEVEVLVLADQALRLKIGRFHDLAEPAESPMETRLRWWLHQAGLPKPQVQAKLHDSSGRFLGRADLYYPQVRLIVEYDGANHRERLIEDNRRQNSLLNAGYKLLRFTAADVLQRIDTVVVQVRSALVAFSRL